MIAQATKIALASAVLTVLAVGFALAQTVGPTAPIYNPPSMPVATPYPLDAPAPITTPTVVSSPSPTTAPLGPPP